MTKKIKVLVFANSFRLGGSERQAVELVKQLDHSKFEVGVACFQKEGPLIEELPRDMEAVEAFPISSLFKPAAMWYALQFFSLLRRNGVQVLQCFDFYSNVFAIPLARLAGVPVILGARRNEASKRTTAQQWYERWCYSLATGVVANAEVIRDQLVRRNHIEPDRVWVIHNGINLDRFKVEPQAIPVPWRTTNDAVIIAVVANLRREKGHGVLLRAASKVCALYPYARFLIVGEGRMRGEIEAELSELKLTNYVHMTGEVTNIPGLLHCVDIVALPSLMNEGLPNVVMEAMAAALPVVATDTGGTRELVVDGHTGYLVQPGDDVGMAENLGNLCRDPEARRKMGDAGRQKIAQEFSVEAMADKFSNLYQVLLQRKS